MRRKAWVPALALWLLGFGHRGDTGGQRRALLGADLIGVAVAVWSAVALVGPYELLMMVVHSFHVPPEDTHESGQEADR